MRQRFVLGVVLLMAGAFLFSGCSKEPTEAVSGVNASLEAAKSAEANVYAPRELQAAEQAKATMDTEIAAQKRKFALFRSYGKSSELAVTAKQLADQATEAAKAGKERARVQAQDMINQVQAGIEEVRGMIATAPRGKGSETDIKALEADLAAVEAQLAQMQKDYAAEQYLPARAKAEAALASLNNIKTAIQTAIEMRGQAKRG